MGRCLAAMRPIGSVVNAGRSKQRPYKDGTMRKRGGWAPSRQA